MTETAINPGNGKPVRRSTSFTGWNTIYAPDGSSYVTRYWFGRLRVHVFHRGDLNEDCHDHPWSFVTFPLRPYVEEVVHRFTDTVDPTGGKDVFLVEQLVVRAWRFHYRPATHCHRVLGPYSGNVWDHVAEEIVPCKARDFDKLSRERGGEIEPFFDHPGDLKGPLPKIVTIVWRGKLNREWGFLKHRDGRWCWQHWKDYVLGTGKDAPCQ